MFTAAIVVGGVIVGIFTATEAAAFAVIYAFVVTFFIYREAPLVRFVKILYSSLKTLAIVMSLIAAASAFGYLLARLQVPRLATEWLLSITSNYFLLLFLINILLLALDVSWIWRRSSSSALRSLSRPGSEDGNGPYPFRHYAPPEPLDRALYPSGGCCFVRWECSGKNLY